jgi:GWxTD domain-containing protein
VEISELVTGKYKLKMKLEDSKLNKKLELEKTFYVINTDTSRKTLSDDAGFLASEYMNYTEEQISDEYDKMVYLMNENSIENFGKLNSTELRRKFLYGFWKNLDPVPYTQLNEFKTEYFSRIVYSNKNFKSELLPGWKTDRGRVYCLYGSPAEIERYPFEATSRAYEIWRYTNVEGGVEFIFIELGSDAGDYTLVHSTKKGEFSDSEWKRRLKVR